MKIAVCGKGGVGKTFIAGSLAEQFVLAGHPVIAIDADSSPNLALTLGLTAEQAKAIIPIAENEELVRLKTGTDYSGVFRLSFTVDDIISKYAVPTPSGASLLVMGTVKAMGSGCSCPAHSVIRALMRYLVVEHEEMVILDMEAGIEHLGRGTAEHVDILLAVTDANLKSLETAATICRLAQESDIRTIALVANRIADERQREAVRSFARQHNLPVIAWVPFDRDVSESGITGEPLNTSTSGAITAIRDLAKTLSGQL
jgi:CO dehydrogenase maturation factor